MYLIHKTCPEGHRYTYPSDYADKLGPIARSIVEPGCPRCIAAKSHGKKAK